MKVIRIFAICSFLLSVSAVHAASLQSLSESRAALVIGNADYQVGKLKNPVNDAKAVASKLEKLGFKVILRENQSREAMHQAISAFSEQLTTGGVGLFYYAGHGMQIKGRNFLIPVDADIQHEDDIEFRGIDANMVLSRMEKARTRVNLVVLDACRNNPFGRVSRSAVNGLAQMDAPKGTLIEFSTAPGYLAMDGTGPHSVYTKHLLEKLALPAYPVEQVFKEVRIAVSKETGGRQIPWESTSLMGDFYFVPPSAAITPTMPAAIPAAPAEQEQIASRAPVLQPPPESPTASLPATDQAQARPRSGRDFNREGYEIEIKASHLTQDELPALEAKAKRGDAIAQTTLGWAYLLGKGQLDGRNIPRSNPKMVSWTKAAAKQGYAVAQNNLGAMYMDGIGVKLDYPKAQHYFKLAADQGYLTAQRNLFHVNAMLGAKPDANLLMDMVKGMQQQIETPVK